MCRGLFYPDLVKMRLEFSQYAVCVDEYHTDRIQMSVKLHAYL